MDLTEAMEKRHSVRAYTDRPVEADIREALALCVQTYNRQGDLHMQLVYDEPEAFGGRMARYGKFSGVKNYVALIGKKSDTLQERIGYYGESLALTAQTLGLNTCWVALTYKKIKTAFTAEKGEKLCCVLAFGYCLLYGHESAEIPFCSRREPRYGRKGNGLLYRHRSRYSEAAFRAGRRCR